MDIRRHAVLGTATLLLLGGGVGGGLAGCASPGARPVSEPTGPAARVTTPPGRDTLPCATTAAKPKRSATAAAIAGAPDESPLSPSPDEAHDENYRGEMMERQMRANRAFLDRHALPESAILGAVKCAVAAEDALKPLAAKKIYDAASATKALAAHGLPGSTVRKTAAHDIGSGDGVTIAAWTGQACIIGYLSPTYGYHVEYGSQIADGGCLAAAD